MEKIIALLVVKLTSLLTRFIPINKKKIVFISYFETHLTGNFKLISDELKKRNKGYKIVHLIRKFDNTLFGKFIYLLNFIMQTYHINTSSAVLLDGNNFPVCNIKKKEETTIIQIWHACGAVKKFGCDISRRFKIRNYDYVYVAGEEFQKTFSTAFNMEKDKILKLGVAKTDILYNKDTMEKYRQQMYKRYPQIKGKKVLLYAPTFRGDGVFDKKYVQLDLSYIYQELEEDYVLLYKMHPFLHDISLGHENNESIINVNHLEIYELFSVSDILVSDYSAVIFDFSILEKPIILYAPDLEEYKAKRGLYYDYEELAPGPICYTKEDMVRVIKNEDYQVKKVRQMKERFFDHQDGQSTGRVVNEIERVLQGGKVVRW